MPVALSILYVALARRVGWVAHALNTPGHVLVSIVKDETILIDPFNHGVTVDTAQLAVLLSEAVGSGVTLGPEHLSPMSNRGILVRLLMNQASRAEQAGRAAGAASTGSPSSRCTLRAVGSSRERDACFRTASSGSSGEGRRFSGRTFSRSSSFSGSRS